MAEAPCGLGFVISPLGDVLAVTAWMALVAWVLAGKRS